eukprot:753670-Hanusia_phi.AAC.3
MSSRLLLPSTPTMFQSVGTLPYPSVPYPTLPRAMYPPSSFLFSYPNGVHQFTTESLYVPHPTPSGTTGN